MLAKLNGIYLKCEKLDFTKVFKFNFEIHTVCPRRSYPYIYLLYKMGNFFFDILRHIFLEVDALFERRDPEIELVQVCPTGIYRRGAARHGRQRGGRRRDREADN